MGGHGTAFAYGAVMGNVDQIVQLGVGTDAGFPHGGAIDGTVTAHLHLIFQYHDA
jgi:hypothetical protein